MQLVDVADLFSAASIVPLSELELDTPYQGRVHSLRRSIEAFTFELDLWTKAVTYGWEAISGYAAVLAILASDRCWPRCSWPRSVRWLVSPQQLCTLRPPIYCWPGSS